MREFNITGTCIPKLNYMVDTSNKLKEILAMIEKGKYFIINRPRQYGKTTTFYLLERELLKNEEYLPIRLRFEGVGDESFVSAEEFCPTFLSLIAIEYNITKNNYSHLFNDKMPMATSWKLLSEALTEILSVINKKVILFIDEVDKAGNNYVFIEFLGMLRDKYLLAREDKGHTFHSVILAGVHDVKTLKLKIKDKSSQPSPDNAHYNSPWNIAVDFEVDMSFNPTEIGTMLTDYINETNHQMDIQAISERLHFWTSGYPFLVSKLCKSIDEKLLPKREDKTWTTDDVEEAVRMLLFETNTLFDDMIKNLENNRDLYLFIKSIVFGYDEHPFSIASPLVNLASLYGMITCNGSNTVKIHNKIFEELLTGYIISKNHIKGTIDNLRGTYSTFVKPDGRLDFDRVMLKFQEGIKEKHSKDDILHSDEFMEKDLRLMFCLYLKGIINGRGYSFKEVQTGEEKRLDIVVVFKDEKFIVELKIWRGQEYHQKGIEQLKGYMTSESVTKGYMLIAGKNKSKEFTHEIEDGIMMVYV
jgi:hypothetical protein